MNLLKTLKISFQKPVLIAHSPNTQWDDVWVALKAIFSYPGLVKGDYSNKLVLELKQKLGYKSVYLFDSARSAEYLLLKALGIGQGDEVAIQAFNCVAVPNSILWTGARPVYVDIKDDLNMNPSDLETKISPNTKAIITQHTFGYMADIEAIQTIAKNHDIDVIEDCSHMIGNTINSRQIGTWGSASFFSLGRDKAISSGFGGVLVVNDLKLNEKVSQLYSKLNYPPVFWILRELKYPVIMKSLVRPLFNFLKLGRVILFIFQKLGLIINATSPTEKSLSLKTGFMPSRLPDSFARLALHQLNKFNRFQSHRDKLASIYHEAFSRYCPYEDIDDVTLLRYPIIHNDAKSIINEIYLNHGILLGDWYRQVVAPLGVNISGLGYNNDCPKAENMCKKVINLPLNINTSVKDAYQITKLLSKILDK